MVAVRAFWASIGDVGQTLSALAFTALFLVLEVLWVLRSGGVAVMKQHIAKNVLVAAGIAVLAWSPFFLYRLAYTPYLMQHEAIEDAKKQEKQLYSFSRNETAYISTYNLLLGFQYLTRPCKVEVTAVRENIEIGKTIASIASGVGCNVAGPGDSDRNPDIEIRAMKGAIPNAVVIHAARGTEGDALVTAFANVFTIRRSYELPEGSPSNLVWFQVGPGSLWRKDENK